VAYCVAGSLRDAAREQGDTDTVNAMRERMRLARLAWQRLDDHLRPTKDQ
jgi:hypothetical protein